MHASAKNRGAHATVQSSKSSLSDDAVRAFEYALRLSELVPAEITSPEHTACLCDARVVGDKFEELDSSLKIGNGRIQRAPCTA